MNTTTAQHDWNAPVTPATRNRPLGQGRSQTFIVVFTADNRPTNGAICLNKAQHLGRNAHGQDLYGGTVKLIEGYTNFSSIPNILRISYGEGLRPVFAQPMDPSGVTYPDPDKAAIWFS